MTLEFVARLPSSITKQQTRAIIRYAKGFLGLFPLRRDTT